ncbi:MAG TPA: hypothetical protein VMM15_24895 [Bradyrhizobium sp.]|nr:hypothetical protein [Bradyrhizobium sp.]
MQVSTFAGERHAAPAPSEEDIARAARIALHRRRVLVNVLRIGFLVLLLGGWELAARLQWIDPFFFAMPSTIAAQIWEWITEGTSQGPLWQQVLVTMEETVLGFLIGAVLQGTFNAAGVFAAMVVLAVVALAAEFLITLLENRLVKWRPAALAETGF